MIGRLNHVAIAVPDLEAACAQYRSASVPMSAPPQDEPDHGVTVVFIELPNTKIELLYPLARTARSRVFSTRTPPRAASTMSVTRSMISSPRATT